jgi:hypothetical protein
MNKMNDAKNKNKNKNENMSDSSREGSNSRSITLVEYVESWSRGGYTHTYLVHF